MYRPAVDVRAITVDVNDLYTIVQAIKKKQNRITLLTDYNTNTIYVTDKNLTYTLKGSR